MERSQPLGDSHGPGLPKDSEIVKKGISFSFHPMRSKLDQRKIFFFLMPMSVGDTFAEIKVNLRKSGKHSASAISEVESAPLSLSTMFPPGLLTAPATDVREQRPLPPLAPGSRTPDIFPRKSPSDALNLDELSNSARTHKKKRSLGSALKTERELEEEYLRPKGNNKGESASYQELVASLRQKDKG